MPRTLRLFYVLALASLAFAPAASAHHWHDRNHDWNGPDSNWNQSDQNWDGPSWNGPSWNNNSDDDTSNNDTSNNDTPNNDTRSTDWGGGGWNSNQGDAQETPSIWKNTPPVNNPWRNHRDRNPWSNIPALPVSKTPTVKGKKAMIRRNGLAAIPKGAPASVRAIISAANTIIGKPYKWGGGHGRLFDSGYDCSGSVSYALIRSGLLGSPMVSGSLARWGAKGAGKYVTIYANKGHVYMEVAGLRLDTSSVGDRGGKSGVRWRPPIGKRFGFAVRHIRGL
jgi:cell wall-associated NlpC family hydrolase